MNVHFTNKRQFSMALKRLGEQLGQEIVRGSQEAGLMLEGKIKEEWPVMSGISGKEITTETGIKRRVVKTRVGSSVKAPWVVVVEEGRKSKAKGGVFPNLDGITSFLARKKSLQSAMGVKQNISVGSHYDELDSNQKGAVFGLARSILKKGIKGKWIFKKTRKKHMGDVRDIINSRVYKFLSE